MLRIGMGLVSLALVLNGCGDDKKRKSQVIDEPFLLAGDLNPTNINPTIGSSVNAKLLYQTAEFQVPKGIFLKNGDVEIPISYSTDFDYCLDTVMRKSITTEIEGEILKIYGTVDMSSCLQQPDKIANENIHGWNGKADIYKEYRCEKLDWTDVDQEKLYKLQPSELGNYCAVSSEIDVLVNIREHVYKKYSSPMATNATETVEDEYTANFSIADSDGEPCTFIRTGAVISVGDCVETAKNRKLASNYWLNDRATYSKSDLLAGYEDYVRIEMEDLQGRTDELWFEQGTFDVQVNDWSGTVQTLPEASAPEFELTREKETIKGVLPPKAPAVRKEAPKFFVRLLD
ncbi:MAG: hypothetical protein AB7T49_07905 [Oligoflexales bacterium]